DFEIFRRSVIALGTHALPALVEARGHCSKEALCPNVILLSSRARWDLRISIRTTLANGPLRPARNAARMDLVSPGPARIAAQIEVLSLRPARNVARLMIGA
ncbi:unnamed protein product, partial [Prunus brigantina]